MCGVPRPVPLNLVFEHVSFASLPLDQSLTLGFVLLTQLFASSVRLFELSLLAFGEPLLFGAVTLLDNSSLRRMDSFGIVREWG